MEFVFALILLGLSCASSSPTCLDEEAYNCHSTDRWERGYPETAADLVDYCKDALDELSCSIEFTDRCPKTFHAAFRRTLVEYREFVGRKLCDKSNPLNQKFVEKASCLNKNKKEANSLCYRVVPKGEWCRRYDLVLKCTTEELTRICGKDGEELIVALYQPEYSRKNVFCPHK